MKFWFRRSLLFKCFCASLLGCCIGLCVLSIISKYVLSWNYTQDTYCYDSNRTGITDILEESPPLGKSIFFHETSCKSHRLGKLVLGKRQACAVESAARSHRNKSVFVLFTSPGEISFDFTTENDRIISALLSYGNVRLRHVNLKEYTKGTPVKRLYTDGTIKSSRYAQFHASDLLRYLTLWRFGGLYLDLDVVVLKSFESLGENYSGAESDDNVAAGVLNFDFRSFGRRFASDCLYDLGRNYKRDDWGNNGPGVITRLAQKLCGTEKAIDMIRRTTCKGFKVYYRRYFYPVRWQNWRKYFDDNETAVYESLKKSYAIHVWNKHSSNTKLPLNSTAPYIVLARKHCPRVLKECDTFF